MFETAKCEKCTKFFIPAKEHLYKLVKKGKTCYYCSYTCWRKDGGDNGGTYHRA